MGAKRWAAVATTVLVGLTAATALASTPAGATETEKSTGQSAAPHGKPGGVRFATFNASLNRAAEGQLLTDLSSPNNKQAAKVAEVIQRVRPDVLLVNEFDYVSGNRAADAFRKNYLARPQQGAKAIDYPYAFTAPVNTGVLSGLDLNRDGKIALPEDGYGFGEFPGQYGMLVLSKYPIQTDQIRTFQNFRWADMPGAVLPKDPKTGKPWYSPEVLKKLRLSSKSHWDLPIRVGRKPVHFLVSHPTPPSFDGPEDRNGTRNHDEIRFWADYVRPGGASGYVYDDKGKRGGIAPNASFVIAGDQNADPSDGDSVRRAALQLLTARRVIDPMPRSAGAPEAADSQGGVNPSHRGDVRLDTADFGDKPPAGPGNLRVDYVLPSAPLIPLAAGVFWPVKADPLARLNDASDHHAVWVDVRAKG